MEEALGEINDLVKDKILKQEIKVTSGGGLNDQIKNKEGYLRLKAEDFALKAKPLLTLIRSELVSKDFKERWETINKIERGEI